MMITKKMERNKPAQKQSQIIMKRLDRDKIGIMSLKDYKKRVIAIAKGEYHPSPNEPKIWFESLKEFERIKKEAKNKKYH